MNIIFEAEAQEAEYLWWDENFPTWETDEVDMEERNLIPANFVTPQED
jgi:hypothetical protein